MPRVKRGVMRHKRHHKILKQASGYWGGKHKLFKSANEQEFSFRLAVAL